MTEVPSYEDIVDALRVRLAGAPQLQDQRARDVGHVPMANGYLKTGRKQWCEDAGEKAETRRRFNARLKERGGFEARRSGPEGANEWYGLQLVKKKTSRFAGKLKKRAVNTHNGSENTASRGEPENSFSSSVTSVEPVPEQLREIRRMVSEGWAEHIAREQVLGKAWVEP